MNKIFGQMVKDQCHGTDFFILLNVDVAYTDPVLAIPLNTMVSLDPRMMSSPELESLFQT